ncbi:MAG: hypothetical protein P4L22_04230 [Candidatus Babeliales bacterium]|nr:hypothetical protein [Candidatus Babeliales bacterium]
MKKTLFFLLISLFLVLPHSSKAADANFAIENAGDNPKSRFLSAFSQLSNHDKIYFTKRLELAESLHLYMLDNEIFDVYKKDNKAFRQAHKAIGLDTLDDEHSIAKSGIEFTNLLVVYIYMLRDLKLDDLKNIENIRQRIKLDKELLEGIKNLK